MTLNYKNLSAKAIEKKCRIFKIEPSEYQDYLSKLMGMQFNKDQAHLILFKTGFPRHIRNIELNIDNLVYHWGFSRHQIAKIVGFGAVGILNEVIFYITPLLSYGYTVENIVKISMHANAKEKLKYLTEKHPYLISLGLNIKNIFTLLSNHPTTESIDNILNLQFSFFQTNSTLESQRSPSRQELARFANTPSPYSHAVLDDYSDRPTPYSHALSNDYSDRPSPYSHALSYDYSDRPSPYSHEVPIYPEELASPSRFNLFDNQLELPAPFGHEPDKSLEYDWEVAFSLSP